MTARPLPFFKQKLNAIAKGLYLEHGWELPHGFQNREQRDRASFDLAHWQQCKRMGRDPKALKETVQCCWDASDSRAGFEAALKTKGLFLARGDRRAFVAVTYEGEVLSLTRMTGRKSKELAARLGEPDGCRDAEETKAHIAATVGPGLRHLLKANDRARLDALAPMEARRLDMKAGHRQRRQTLGDAQRQRHEGETRDRAARLRQGVAGLWDRLTGRRKETLRVNETEARQCDLRDRAERHDLVTAQLAERRGLQGDLLKVRARFEGLADELRADLARQGVAAEPEGLSDSFAAASGSADLTSSFASAAEPSSSSRAAAMPSRILRARTAFAERARGGPDI